MARIRHFTNMDIGLLTLICVFRIVTSTPSGDGLREPLTYYVQEELPTGHVVGQMTSDADLSRSHSSEVLASLRYHFIMNTNGHHELFNLTENGILLTKISIDRDIFCPMKEECVLTLDIEISPIQYFQIIKVNIIILDINDNPPAFEESVMYISLAESIPVGSVIPIPMAYDPDSPQNGVSLYELRVKNDSFRLLFGLKADDNLHDLLGEIYLEILDNLDREQMSRYILEIVALEGKHPESKQAVLMVHISVTDVNDNMPQFVQDKYSVTVAESITVDTPIIKVKATDLDSGENSQISYALSSRTIRNYGMVFSVHNKTGEIFVNEPLDFEEENHYNLVVVASDRMSDSLTGEAVISINVTDVNDNAPYITVTSLGTNVGSIELNENADPETPILHISVTDPDEGFGGVVECVLNDTRFLLSQIYSSDFMLKAIVSFDYEVIAHVDVSLSCTDNGDPRLTSQKLIQISVIDDNDNAPTFSQALYHIILSGDVHKGEILHQVSASDSDSGQNGNITYTIIDSDMAHLFAIDTYSGIIYSKVDISNIFMWDFSIDIEAQDMGVIPMTSRTTVMLSSTADRTCVHNTSHPDHNTTIFHVMENQRANMTIGKLNTTTSASLTTELCTISSELYPVELRNSFAVDMNGYMITKQSLDREVRGCYCASLVTVQTCIYPDLPTTITLQNIHIEIGDENDNAPIPIFPSGSNNTVMINSGSEINNLLWIARIQGADVDTIKNAQLTYAIMAEDQFPFLWLNPDTGDIFLVSDIPDDLSTRPVQIRISDSGSPSLSTLTYLWILRNGSATNSVSMVDADNLVKVLSVAVPCAFLIVLGIVLIVLLIRKQFCCQQKNDHDHEGAEDKTGNLNTEKKDEKLDKICRDLGQEEVQDTVQNPSLYITSQDHRNGYTDDNGHMVSGAHQKTSTDDVIPPGPRVLSSQDSDSGCSADMSHSTSTTDSWAVQGLLIRPQLYNVSHTGRIPTRQYPRLVHDQLDCVDHGCVSAVNMQARDHKIQERPYNEMKASSHYDNQTYIRSDKVRKYGHLNDGYQSDSGIINNVRHHQDNIDSGSFNLHRSHNHDANTILADDTTDNRWHPSMKPSYDDVVRGHSATVVNAALQNKFQAAPHAHTRPENVACIRRSHSYSDGRRDVNSDVSYPGQSDWSPTHSATTTNPYRYTHNTDDRYTEGNYSPDNGQRASPKKKKIIYEAQV